MGLILEESDDANFEDDVSTKSGMRESIGSSGNRDSLKSTEHIPINGATHELTAYTKQTKSHLPPSRIT